MNITLERQSNCAAKLKVEIPAEDVSGERKNIVQAFSRQARIRGYRPGKVPRTVIEKRFGEQITAELESRLIQKALREAAEKEDLRIIDAKPPEDTAHQPDGALTFSSTLTIAPEFELPEYKGITLELPNRVIGPEDVDQELEDLRSRFADFTDVTDRPVQSGDFAVIDYSSQHEGKLLEETAGQSVGYLAGSEDYWLKMEDDSLLPGFSQALQGAAIGEERDFALTVPEDFPVEELRGRVLDFHTALKAIKDQVLPEWDDDLAGQIVPGSDLKGLKETIRGNLEHQLNQQIEEFKVNQLLEKLNKAVSFELPADLVTAETQGQADEMVERGLGSGMSEEEIEARQNEIFSAANQRAQMNLRTDFILQRIAEREKLEVTREELANRVAALANQAKKPIKTFAQSLQQSGRLTGLQHSMLLSKTIDFLLENAMVEVTDQSPAEEDVPQEPEEAPPEPAPEPTEESENDDE